MTNEKRIKLLIIFTIIEVLCIGIYVYTCAKTFDYSIAVAIDGFTQPWLGSHMDAVAAEYDVDTMNAMFTLGNTVLFMLVVAIVVRFGLSKPKYKTFFGIGMGLGFVGYVILALSGMLAVGFVFFLVGFGFICYSHWIGKEYRENPYGNA